MSLENILKRRALRLKAEISEGKTTKSNILSVIYPAMDHGKNMPPQVKTPCSVPGPNDGSGKETDDQPEKGEKEKDGPGTSKPMDLVPGGQGSVVTPAHKKAAFELGYFGENRSEKFISRCVELITGVTRVEQTTEVKPDVPCEVSGSCSPTESTTIGGKDRLRSVLSKFKAKGKPVTGHG